jgi:thiamine-monophosphate kinase
VKSEFEFINYIKKSYGLSAIGDDCAVLPKDEKTDMVVTADMLVEDVDFRLEWTTPEFLGHKALAVSLSDIAAMGAVPKWAMLTLAVPEDLWKTTFIEQFFDGWTALATQYEVALVGGDISRSPDKFVIDSIVGGEVKKGQAILRSGAEHCESIFVTENLGGSATGLHLLNNGIKLESAEVDTEFDFLRRHLTPMPRVSYGVWLNQGNVASAMLDISDGLLSDLNHLCEQSKVGARIYAEKIPLDDNAPDILGSEEASLENALNGGEDFELLFTAKEQDVSAYFKGIFPCIGEITSTVGVIELVRDGQVKIVQPRGYQHF